MPYAIVTGATQGIGKAIVEKLLEQGFSVATCARNSINIEKVRREWKEHYPSADILAVTADMTDKDEVIRFANAVREQFPTVNLLVNNAGAYQPGNLADEPEGLLEKMLGINLYSAYHLTRRILPVMIDNNAGHIFNMCSVASLRAYPNGGSYSISKYAMLGFSENLREELRQHNIKVTSICPGATWSPSWEGSGVEQHRIMETNDIANTIWSIYTLSAQANVDTIVLRPVKGDL